MNAFGGMFAAAAAVGYHHHQDPYSRMYQVRVADCKCEIFRNGQIFEDMNQEQQMEQVANMKTDFRQPAFHQMKT